MARRFTPRYSRSCGPRRHTRSACFTSCRRSSRRCCACWPNSARKGRPRSPSSGVADHASRTKLVCGGSNASSSAWPSCSHIGHLFVRRHLSAAQKKLLKRLVRGQPQLRVLRDIMDEVYRLFDRRCKTATALRRLEKLRQRVRRFKRLARALAVLNSPNLEKALLYLDDKLLGATSNAVERSNRRFRKAQKSIYSVRTKGHIEQRLALDMNREQRAAKRARTLKTLHRARSDPESGHYCCYSVPFTAKIARRKFVALVGAPNSGSPPRRRGPRGAAASSLQKCADRAFSAEGQPLGGLPAQALRGRRETIGTWAPPPRRARADRGPIAEGGEWAGSLAGTATNANRRERLLSAFASTRRSGLFAADRKAPCPSTLEMYIPVAPRLRCGRRLASITIGRHRAGHILRVARTETFPRQLVGL